jgi:alanyl-tRNA synthetase
MTFLIADGVVPSNEDRGYALRRVMRRAIQQGRSIGMEPGFLPRFTDRVVEIMGRGYPELVRERDAIARWAESEEVGFGRTLEQGSKLLDDLIAQAKERGDEGISGEDAFRLHDTFGFPIELTRELVAEHDLGVADHDFEEEMRAQRERSRSVVRGVAGAGEVQALPGPAAEFVGYDTLASDTSVVAVEPLEGDRFAVKLATSPFYATGGGQIADVGEIACAEGDCALTVVDVKRFGDDQVLVTEGRPPREGEHVHATVDRAARTATQANHTATHLLHAALREALGTHVRQAGSYVGPDKLRFDFTHGAGLTPDELRAVEDRVNEWVLRNDPVRPQTTTLDEARAAGAMALFGEKYGDVVRMVEVGDGSYSRELCGGTHVRSTAEIGVFKLVSETSSAANVRRIEAVTGTEAVALLRRHDAILRDTATALRKRPEEVAAAVADLRDKAKQAARAGGAANGAAADVGPLVERAADVDGAKVVAEVVDVADPKALLAMADTARGRLGDAAVVLGSAADGRVHLVAMVAPALVARGVKAGELVKIAARVVGGGGGGRDTMAQAGGRDPEKLPEALQAARAAIEAALA